MNEISPYMIKPMRIHLINGMYAAEKSYKTLKTPGKISDDRRITIALAHLNQANIFITTAQTIYHLGITRKNPEIERFFHLFNVFNDEFINSISPGQSEQWTDFEFRKLVNHYNKLPEIFDLKPFYVD
ncbi:MULTISPECIES: hypothetical protein [Bacillus]|uniref:hypothetical protein n=1 Tax=Bacillus TaxID=1386 RepID=UPI0010717944|nr:hypothetical protein [Bacillus aerius]MDH6598416.1 hypothetical protein [Bacillus aerius]TFV12246.1 hypothetical protein E4T85_00090 [Bacillus stratosphericus]